MSKKTAGSDAVNKPVRSDSAKKSVGSGNVRKKAPGKKTQKKELKISRRTIIAGAAVLGAVLCVVILFAVVSFRRAQAVSIPAGRGECSAHVSRRPGSLFLQKYA